MNNHHSPTVESNPILQTTGGLVVITLLSSIAWWLSRQVYGLKLPLGIPGKAFEFTLWAVLVGLVGNVILRLLQLRTLVKPGIRTELFLNIGLILLGAGINLKTIATAASGAVLQAAIIITAVFCFSWWLAGKFGLDDRLRAVMSAALAVCGVSAAIAAAGAVSARKEQVTYVTGLVIVVALPMMVLAPLLAQTMGLSQPVAGAWFGGNIDTSAGVVGAGTVYGETAQQVATIVKSTQNTAIGLVVFFLALFFAAQHPDQTGKPNLTLLWQRFPKFVLGFMLASVLFSLGWIDGGKGTAIEAMKNWAFTAAFVAMGLDFSLGEFRRMGWKPVAVYLIATLFNTLLALLTAWLIFS